MHKLGQLNSDNLPLTLEGDGFNRIFQSLKKQSEQPKQAKKDEESESIGSTQETFIRVSSLDQIPSSFSKLGTGFYKDAHSLWQLKPTTKGHYVLIRATQEPIFDDDKGVENTPTNTIPTQPPKTASQTPEIIDFSLQSALVLDKYGKSLGIHDTVTYITPTNETKTGKITHIKKGIAVVTFDNKTTNNIPTELLEKVSDTIPPEQKDPYKSQAENDEHNMVPPRPKRKQAVDETAKQYWTDFWGSYGAALVDEKPIKSYTTDKKAYTWNELETIFGKNHITDIKTHLANGIKYRKASKDWNLCYTLTKAIFPVLNNYKPWEAKKIADHIKTSIKNNDLDPVHKYYGPEIYKAAQSLQTLVNKNMTKIAVDQAAMDYWISYYGTYGQALIQEVKKRITADLLENESVQKD